MKLVNNMKNKKFYHILLGLLIGIYTFMFYVFNFCMIHYHFVKSLVVLIPVIICFVIYWLLKKGKIKNRLALVFTVVSTICFFMLAFFLMILLFFDEGMSYEDNPWKYNHIKKIANYTSYTYQFPSELSSEFLRDRKVKLYYTPQFLQGAFQLNLLIELNENEMNEYIEKYEENSKIVVNMKEKLNEDLKQYAIYEPYGIFKEYEFERFSENATFYIFESKSYKPNDWNHGVVQYMAKNEELAQLLLATEVW